MGHLQRHGNGHYELAELFVQHGFDINHNEGRTPLHAFAAHEDVRGVIWLLEHGADVDARDVEGNTPLHVAAARNAGTKVLQVLVEHGAQVEARNAAGETALDRAGAGGKGRGAGWLAGMGR
ncbi:MAG: ankyrin repeat domain-containing protein [Armatimonadetes bacterium]|nr:ankyrin repeat domain-containing protein [Armatimonadota bacterium]